ncbi:DUF808 family protein [Bizionia sp.]|uniref:DUF808 family protein n=1 Tax=Bizionia sp. TaxID=1954480 RepID=UPI003A956675
MASGFFALLDDIGALMDDVAVLSKVTTKKTAGILGDDLAVNAEKASGFVSSREIPVLWAITKGSFINKLIILPLAFLLSAFFPAAVTVILVLGGVYLAFEGAEKIYEYVVPHKHAEGSTPDVAVVLTEEEVLELEKTKVKSAIITDFILSVEIVIIALGAVMGQTLLLQIIVVTIVAIIATVGVYGIVALIVRMDDFGLKLIENSNGTGFGYRFGTLLVGALPYVIKSLSVIGTIALLLVSGGIFAHNLDFFHHVLASWPALIREFLIGLVIGLLAVVVFKVVLWVIGMVRG